MTREVRGKRKEVNKGGSTSRPRLWATGALCSGDMWETGKNSPECHGYLAIVPVGMGRATGIKVGP